MPFEKKSAYLALFARGDEYASALLDCETSRRAHPQDGPDSETVSKVKAAHREFNTAFYDLALVAPHQSPAAQARAGIKKQDATKTLAVTTTDRLNDDCQRALQIFTEVGKASTSLLQRKLGVGYGRASRIMDALRERGLIEEPTGLNAASKLVE